MHIGLIGGIDASALTERDDAVRRVVGETAPPLLAGGRYIPCLNDDADHCELMAGLVEQHTQGWGPGMDDPSQM